MIKDRELRAQAKTLNINPATLEKDYALTCLLYGFYLPRSNLREILVLKGGTAIRKGYFPDKWRFSEDLDFTVINIVTSRQVKEAIQEIILELLEKFNIKYELDSYHRNENVIMMYMKFIGPLNYKNKIKLDISLNEKICINPEWRYVSPIFFDIPKFEIYSYSLLEIITEKIRSIIQRGYSRDYYDVWRLMKEENFNKNEVKKFLVQKCKLKDIDYQPDLLFDSQRLKDAKTHWFEGLGRLMNELPDFDKVISDLRILLAFLTK